jgi:colanic acid biosynthesis glycosyl transferase WcaI
VQNGKSLTNLVIVNRYFFPDESATAQLASTLAFALADRGWRVHLVTSRQLYGNANATLARREDIGRVRVHRVWTSRFGRRQLAGRAIDYLTFYLSTFWRLLRLARRGDVVVATTDPPLLSVLVWLATRVVRAKQINWLQDLFPEVAVELGVIPDGRMRRLFCHLRNRSLRHAVMNVAIGDKMGRGLQRHGVPAAHSTVLHNWADGEAIQPLPPRLNQLRAAWELADKFVIGYSGNLGRAHEFMTILRAAEALRDEPDIRFLFIGDGYYRALIETETRHRGLSNVVIKPFQPASRLRESLAVPDVHLVSLHPALEGLIVPSKFYGIAAAGRPTIYIGDPAGEIPAILESADCGATVSVGDASALVAHIRALQRSPAQRERWGRNARAIFVHRFDREQAVRRWSDIIAYAAGMALESGAGAKVDAWAHEPGTTVGS